MIFGGEPGPSSLKESHFYQQVHPSSEACHPWVVPDAATSGCSGWPKDHEGCRNGNGGDGDGDSPAASQGSYCCLVHGGSSHLSQNPSARMAPGYCNPDGRILRRTAEAWCCAPQPRTWAASQGSPSKAAHSSPNSECPTPHPHPFQPMQLQSAEKPQTDSAKDQVLPPISIIPSTTLPSPRRSYQNHSTEQIERRNGRKIG